MKAKIRKEFGRMFDKFTGLYKVSKTLRFELKPVGKTLENIKKFKILENDRVRDAQYERMKDILDLQHRALLERSLERVGEEEDVGDWVALAEAYKKFRTGKKDKAARTLLDKKLEAMRRSIVAAFSEDEMFNELTEATPSKFIKRMVKTEGEIDSDDQSTLNAFDSFACYFTGYQENRKNIYSDKPQTTAAAYRAIDVNFPKFLEAVDVVNHIQATYPKIIIDAEKELAEKLCGKRLAKIFSIKSYGSYLSQKGIDFCNLVLGGYSPVDGEKKRGLNEFINLKRQQDADAVADFKLHKIAPLYKQILSEREGESFRFAAFEKDSDVILAIKDFAKRLGSDARMLKAKLSTITKSERIYVNGATLADVSKNLCGNWSALESAMMDAAEVRYRVLGSEKKIKKAVDEWMKSKVFPLADLPDVTLKDETCDMGVKTYRILDCWRGEYAQKVFEALKVATVAMMAMPDEADDQETPLKENARRVEIIKTYLDAVQDVLHLVKPLAVSAELDRDMDFYAEFDECYARIDEVVPLYNKVRNYVTKKVGEVEKMKLMFDCASLGDGWDLNKEVANRCVLFMRKGCYYLGVMRPKCKINFDAMKSVAGETYQKMVYKYLPGPNKMLPKVVFSERGKLKYRPSRALIEAYNKKCHIKNSPTFKLAFCHELIDFFKDAISKNEDWSVFGFKFSPTKNYTGIDGFYKEITEQGYKVDFVNVAAKDVDELIKCGDLFMFQIYNKDFAEGAKGLPNLHTLYWNSVFSPENLAKPVVQLCGGAELFCRPVAIKKPYAHEIGEKMLNRWTKDGEPIPETVFGELFDFINGKLPESKLGVDAKMLLENGQLVVKAVTHRIIKDARYARDEFFLHVPIAFNATAAGEPCRFNDNVNAAIAANPKVNIIGLDRGERHLIYFTLINQKGEILLQKSFNTITGATYDGHVREVDYQKKLTAMEKGRDAARKSWSEIGKIKDLKSGYISLVVHEIVSLMLKYNAIVVMEDLNFGFKRGRFKVERQVYQKFEKALIDKLNYLVFKDEDATSAGGVLRGYQLADKFESFEKLGKQTGFVYYVPAGYTSKIDPTTGFTNLFNTKKCTNAVGIAEFFSRFDSIVYDAERKSFAFKFDYSNFKVSQTSWKKDWTVYSAERRLVFDVKARSEREISPTQVIVDALKRAGKTVSDGFDLKAFLAELEPSKANAVLFHDVFFAFERTLQMRNSCAATGEDYIASPVMNSSGEFFDSRESGDDLPKNADANGAYHIALKGLYLIKNRLGKEKVDLKITHEQWFEFAQNR